MKNHFFYPYFGNKREEVEIIINSILQHNNKFFDDKKTIIEPFCGSSAISYYLSTLYPGKFTYILNDNDKYLIDLYNLALDDNKLIEFEKDVNETLQKITSKEDYLKVINDGSLIGYYICKKIYKIRPGLYNQKYKYKNTKINIQNFSIVKFIKNEKIIFKNTDAIEIIKNYSNNEENVFFLDPPYIDTHNNDFYANHNINIYKYLKENPILNNDSNIFIIVKKCTKIDLLFKDYYIEEYNKMYGNFGNTNKKKIHYIIYNKDL